jgi:hypothetical protein
MGNTSVAQQWIYANNTENAAFSTVIFTPRSITTEVILLFACVFVFTGMCLLSRCLEIGLHTKADDLWTEKCYFSSVTEFSSIVTEMVHLNLYNNEDSETFMHVYNVVTSPGILKNKKKVSTIRLLSIFILVSPLTGHVCVLVTRSLSLTFHITLLFFFMLAIVTDGMGAPLFRPQSDPFIRFLLPVADS